MNHPIAMLVRPPRAFLLALSLLAVYGLLLAGAVDVSTAPPLDGEVDCAEVSPVELLE